MTLIKTLLISCALLFCVTASFADDEQISTGTVAETMTSGGYVYVRLEENDRWLASTTIPVSIGDKVSYKGGAEMKDFHSRTLDRTFDWILFVGKLEVADQFNAEMHEIAAASEMYDFKNSATAEAPKIGEITPLEDGKTIEAIHAEYQQLKDQEIAFRARVMKISTNILGKNWVTLQDGTGTAPNNKLIATSSELVTIGDLVTVKGLIKTDVDIGSGYKYEVIMEEATFSK